MISGSGTSTETNRWLTRDPLGMVDGPNMYAYLRGNPVSFVDPMGGWAFLIPILGGAAVGGGMGAFNAWQAGCSGAQILGHGLVGAAAGAAITGGAMLGGPGVVGPTLGAMSAGMGLSLTLEGLGLKPSNLPSEVVWPGVSGAAYGLAQIHPVGRVVAPVFPGALPQLANQVENAKQNPCN